MYTNSQAYRDAIEAMDRDIQINMTVGADIDVTAPDDVTDITADSLPMSNHSQIIDYNFEMTQEMATYEAYGIPTALSAGMLVPPLTATQYPPEIGIWSDVISDADGNIDWSMELELSEAHTSALTIYTTVADIAEGTATFYHTYIDEDTQQEVTDSETVPLTPHAVYAVASGSYTYDRIVIHITRINQAFRHIRIVEIEFGDSITIEGDTLVGEVTFIDEIDVLQQGIPLAELDMELINIGGEYDEDRPGTYASRMKIGNPLMLSYIVKDGPRRTTIPMARMYIGSKFGSNDRLGVTAFDIRWKLTQTYHEWALDINEDLGTTITALFMALEVPYEIDPALFDMHPLGNYQFTDSTTVFEDLIKLAQAYGILFLPTRGGAIRALSSWPSDDYGLVPPENMMTYMAQSQMSRYNFIDVRYGTGSTFSRYTRDLRTDPNTGKIIITVNNDLIVDQSQAVAVASRIEANLYTQAQSFNWRGDPSLDLSDRMQIHTRWTRESTAGTYRAVKRELTYDGGLTETTTVIH